MTYCSAWRRDGFRQPAMNSECSLTRLTYPTVQLPQTSIDWSASRALKLLLFSSSRQGTKISDSFTETWSTYKIWRRDWCILSDQAIVSAYTSSHTESFTYPYQFAFAFNLKRMHLHSCFAHKETSYAKVCLFSFLSVTARLFTISISINYYFWTTFFLKKNDTKRNICIQHKLTVQRQTYSLLKETQWGWAVLGFINKWMMRWLR